jgi:tetratricopeptide (TPR) repeat protein
MSNVRGGRHPWAVALVLLCAACCTHSAMAATKPWASAPSREVEPLATELRTALARVQTLLEAGDFRAALDVLEVVAWDAANAHEHAQVDSMAGYAWYGLGDYERAIVAYRRALLDPERVPLRLETAALYSLAELSLAVGDYPGALDYATRWSALGQTPDATALVTVAKIHYAVGDYDGAVTRLATAITSLDDPRGAPDEWWMLLAYLCQETGNASRLVELIEEYATDYPDAMWDVRLAAARAQRDQPPHGQRPAPVTQEGPARG